MNFLVPRGCAFCGSEAIGNERNICAACFDDLPWCSTPISPAPNPFECCASMVHYSFPVDTAIKALKFKRKLHYAPAFAEILSSAQAFLPIDIDVVVPVPLHWRRKTIRGFNQASEIAVPLAKSLKIPVVGLARRVKPTSFQSGLDARQRTSNLRQAFSSTKAPRFDHALIVDDIITTGATVSELARTLHRSGTKKVSVLTVARAR